jgi:L-tyrosine isonitrile synthase
MGGTLEDRQHQMHCPRRSDTKKRAEKIVSAFNTWSFKREQPCTPEKLHRAVATAVETMQPVPFVLYWGKGPRQHCDMPENDCLDYLKSMLDRVAATYEVGSHLELLLTDTHARLNNHPQQAIDNYFASVRTEASKRGIGSRLLSSLSPDAGTPRSTRVMTIPSESTISALIASASKWYGGRGSSRDGALAYYAMNMRERELVEQNYGTAIFVTFNGSEFRSLFPEQLPIFYMYSVRKGCAVKPWFMPGQEAAQVNMTPSPLRMGS